VWPRPRVFEGSAGSKPAESALRIGGRARTSRPATSDLALDAAIRSECVDASEQWTFVRDGVFATARHNGSTIEALPDGSQLYVRISAPFSTETVEAVLEAGADGIYRGTANASTACGWKAMTITAKPR
jgi:hypothetical protein